jgi:hypothetical protein
MRRTGLILAVVVVLAADAFVLLKAALNRSGPPTSTIELTEREMRLVRPQSESTALFLHLTWEPAPNAHKFEDGPGWFDRAKLGELGFDCSVPLTDPSAASHYYAMSAREAFAVLHYDGAAAVDESADNAMRSRLVLIDAGRDPDTLRRKYPDPRRDLIVPSMVRLQYEAKWDSNTQRFSPAAYLRGAVVQLQVGEISVPPAQQRTLGTLRETTYEYIRTPTEPARSPRYSVVLSYGKNYEPWIDSCRLIGVAQR